MRHLVRLALVAAALTASVSTVGASRASAQSTLDTAEAQAFLGTWATSLDSPEGPMPTTFAITDAAGKVALRVDFGALGDLPVTDVTKSGEGLLARFAIDYQGSAVPVALTLTPQGENLRADWDFADGAFTLSTTATKS